jgi:hypothetical protein
LDGKQMKNSILLSLTVMLAVLPSCVAQRPAANTTASPVNATQVNGGTVPTSAGVLGTDSNGKPIAATSTQIQTAIGSSVYDASGAAAAAVAGAMSGTAAKATNFATQITGVVMGNGASAPSAATGAQIASALGSTAVSNATTAASTSGNSATATNFQTQITGPVMGNGSSAPSAATTHNLSGPANCTTTGSSNAYACTTSPTFTPAAGDHIQINFNVANTGSATLNVNSSTAYTIYKNGGTSAVASGDIQANHWVSATLDSNNHWQLEGQLGQVNATQVNGAAVNATAALAATNTNGQIVAATATQLGTLVNIPQYEIHVSGGASASVAGISLPGTANTPLLGATAGNPSWSTIAYPASATGGGFCGASSNTQLACSTYTANAIPKMPSSAGTPVASSIIDNATDVVTTEPSYSASGVVGTGTSGIGTSPTSTGVTFPATVSGTARLYRGHCAIAWQQVTAVSTVTWGIVANNAPTYLYVMNQDSPGSYKAPVYTSYGTGTSNVNISAADAPTAFGTTYVDYIDLTLSATSTATTLTINATSGSGTDTVSIIAGSYCSWLP